MIISNYLYQQSNFYKSFWELKTTLSLTWYIFNSLRYFPELLKIKYTSHESLPASVLVQVFCLFWKKMAEINSFFVVVGSLSWWFHGWFSEEMNSHRLLLSCTKWPWSANVVPHFTEEDKRKRIARELFPRLPGIL